MRPLEIFTETFFITGLGLHPNPHGFFIMNKLGVAAKIARREFLLDFFTREKKY